MVGAKAGKGPPSKVGEGKEEGGKRRKNV